jgi:uncharacterized membrane protein
VTSEQSWRAGHAPTRAPRAVAWVLIISAVGGVVAAVALTVEKLQLLRTPGGRLSCDVSVLVACGKGLQSWQGSLLNFPNSIVGIAAWSVLLVIGLTMLTRSTFAFAVWVGLNIGLLAGLGLVIFLIYQSIYVLGTLCPWCMATWVVMIPSALTVLFFSLQPSAVGVFIDRAQTGVSGDGMDPAHIVDLLSDRGRPRAGAARCTRLAVIRSTRR